MPLVYSSNSPQFLEYIASCKTREDVINDPVLCVLLNDPHIKDNMELAFLAREADYGDRNKKSEFIGFFLANGPELDTDTIMHYRNKILMSYAYSTIAKEDYSDIKTVDKLRVEKYGKEIDTSDNAEDAEKNNNCFKNPCDYLQPMSAALGMIGDSENFKTLTNIFARKNKESQDEKDKANSENNKSDSKDNKSDSEDEEKFETTDGVWGNIRKHMSSRIIPAFQEAYRVLLKTLGNQMLSLFEKDKEAGMEKEVTSIGDSSAEKIAENISGAVKTNIFAKLGDCARIWEHMRRLNLYDPVQNTKAPADVMSISSNRTPEGTPRNMPQVRTENNERQMPLTTTAAGANASPKPLSMRDTVHAFLRTEAHRIIEELKADNNWDNMMGFNQTALKEAVEGSTPVYFAWEFCAINHGWPDGVWQEERKKDSYAMSDKVESNIYLDPESSYWHTFSSEDDYNKKSAEYKALFGDELIDIYTEPEKEGQEGSQENNINTPPAPSTPPIQESKSEPELDEDDIPLTLD